METETEASVPPATKYVYDALPGLHFAFSPEEALDDAAAPTAAAAGQDEDDATATYAVFRNEITAAGDALADIPAADFFSLDVSAPASHSVEAEPEPASPRTPAPAAAAATPSGSRALQDQPAQGSERAWFRGGRRFRSPMLQLHKEILDFCDFISPSAEEQSSRTAAVQDVSDVVKHIWPQCKVEVFGSFRTGLYLPTSDIDVVIFESRVKTPQVGLYALAKALSQKGVAKKIQVMEDGEESPRMLPLGASSVESRMNRKKMSASTGNRGGRGRGRGSVPAKSATPTASISTDTNMHLEPLAMDENQGEDFDMNAEISVSVPTDDDADDDPVTEEVGDDVSVPSNPSKATRGRKGKRSGVHLSPSKVKLKRGKRAGCWKYFKLIKVQSEKEFGVLETKAKCKFCMKSYVYHEGGATSQLNRHLAKCTQYQNKLAKAKRLLAQGTLNYVADDGCLIVNPTEYDHDHTRKLIAKMIIVHEYPFRMVEHKWFNILMKWMNSNYECIGRKTIKNECMKVYESEKEQLKKSLREAESISLTTDLWTSNQNVQYMCLVAHYIDSDWVLQCRVLNFLELDPPHTGLVIAHAIFECLVEWKIEDKVMSITLDNASNNDVATTNLSAKLVARKNGQFDPKYFHIRCAAHIVNLVVNDGLEPIEGLISELRNTVKYFKRSPSRLYKFVEVCNDYAIKVGKCLSLDVKTRWNSTYKMLNTCIEYRAAFGYYALVDQNYAWKPTDSQWDMYEKIRPILGEMAEATTAFSGSVYPTANVFYPYILKVKLALLRAKNERDPYLKNMGAAMLEKFDKYWEEKNNVMVIATILDPRFKMKYIEFYFRELYGSSRCEQEVADIKKELEELYEKHELEQRRKMGGSSSSSTTQSASSSKESTSLVACLVSSEFQSFLESSASETSKSELLIYLDEANHPLNDKNFNLLNYWKVNAPRFPVVSSMAKKFLAVPASSVSSESTFSCGGRVLDDYRSSLKPATVQALVCASSWIRGSKSPPIILGEDGDDGDIESVELPRSVVESN